MSARVKASVIPSDAAVFAAARKRLDECPTVPGTVRVHVEGDLVTLTGTVQHAAQRMDAEHVVQPVIDERRLVNNIVVMAPAVGEFEPPDNRS
jgi:osmotically-inducible protein OsmY